VKGSASTKSTLLIVCRRAVLPLAGLSLPVILPMGSTRTTRFTSQAPGYILSNVSVFLSSLPTTFNDTLGDFLSIIAYPLSVS
jgi:hypothetical protein